MAFTTATLPRATNLYGEVLNPDELRDTAVMFIDTRRRVQDIIATHRRVVARGQADLLAQVQQDAELEISIIRNAWRTWRSAGGWNTYYQVTTQPATYHSLMSCHTIGTRTGIRLVGAFTGCSPDHVADLGHRVCRHCLRRGPGESFAAAGKLVERMIGLLDRCKQPVCTQPQNSSNIANAELDEIAAR